MAVKKLVLPAARRFYQSVRMILKVWNKQDQHRFDNCPLNVLRFTSSLKLTAAETEVEDLAVIRDDGVVSFELMVNDFGLLGTHGALPHGYTEWIAEQIFRHNDMAMKYFLDIFNHRINSLRFELWKKSHLFVSRELDNDFRYPAIFNAVAGAWGRDAPHPELIRPDNATLWARRTLVNLVRLLQREFNCPVDITPFQGAWVEIESTAWGRLGNSELALGAGLVLGKKYWEIHASFHIKIGPVEYHDLITEKQNKLKGIVQLYVCHSVSFSSEFISSTTCCENKLNGKYQLGLSCCLGQLSEDQYVVIKYSH